MDKPHNKPQQMKKRRDKIFMADIIKHPLADSLFDLSSQKGEFD